MCRQEGGPPCSDTSGVLPRDMRLSSTWKHLWGRGPGWIGCVFHPWFGWMTQPWFVQRCIGRTQSLSKGQKNRRTPCLCCTHPSEKKLHFLVRSCQGLQGDCIHSPVFPRDTVGCEPEIVPFKRERSKTRMGTNRHQRDSAAGWRSTMERRVVDSTRE